MAHIIEDNERVILKARFAPAQEVYLLLEQGGDTACYRVDTSGDVFAGMSGMPQIPPDDRNTQTPVNKHGRSGEYGVYLVIDGLKYVTGVKISC